MESGKREREAGGRGLREISAKGVHLPFENEEQHDDPVGEMFVCGFADLVKSRRIGSYGKFVPVH